MRVLSKALFLFNSFRSIKKRNIVVQTNKAVMINEDADERPVIMPYNNTILEIPKDGSNRQVIMIRNQRDIL